MPRAALLLVLALSAAAGPASARAGAPALRDLHVTNGSTPSLGDGPSSRPSARTATASGTPRSSGDTWYANGRTHALDLTRPFLDFGIPFRFHDWDLTFLTWLQQKSKTVDYLSDEDVDRIASGDELARRYDLIVFPGHEEYVTKHELDVVTRYRDLGGNLAFLAANNMFWLVRVDAGVMRKVGLWRDAGRPEASLVGAQYAGSNHGGVQAPFQVTGAAQAPWLFAGTGLQNGSSFGRYGIEIDATGPASPPGTIVLARIPDLLGRGGRPR